MPQLNQEDFFDELKEWSERKLQLLKNYVETAAKILGSIKQAYYVDGFAGAGTYADGAKGSPVRIAELAQQWERDKKSYSLRCINVEENSENFANLQAATSMFGKLVLNLQGSFADNLDHILHMIGTKPAIFFLDPFGIKDIGWTAVRKIINRSAPTDIWIRFDHVIVRRLDGLFETDRKMFNILSRAYGIQDGEYLHLRLQGDTAQDRIQNAVQLYKDCLARELTNAKRTGYTGAYPIKSLDGQSKYYLVFATAHAKGITLASEIVYAAEETYQREVQEYKEARTSQLALFSLDPKPEEIFLDKVDNLKEDIWRLYQGKTSLRIDIYTSILENWFGRIKGKHVTQALKDLQKDGRILRTDGPMSQDRTRFTFRDSN